MTCPTPHKAHYKSQRQAWESMSPASRLYFRPYTCPSGDHAHLTTRSSKVKRGGVRMPDGTRRYYQRTTRWKV